MYSFVAERRQVLGGEQPSAVAGRRGRTSGTWYMDGEIRLPVVSFGIQRRPWQCVAVPVSLLLKWRGRFSNTVHSDAHYRGTASNVHGAFLR